MWYGAGLWSAEQWLELDREGEGERARIALLYNGEIVAVLFGAWIGCADR